MCLGPVQPSPGPAAVVSVAGPVPSHERSYRTDPSQGAPDDDLINPPGSADKITAELDMSLNYVYLRGIGIVVCVAREMLVTDQGNTSGKEYCVGWPWGGDRTCGSSHGTGSLDK